MSDTHRKAKPISEGKMQCQDSNETPKSTSSPKSTPSSTGDPWSSAKLLINGYWTRLRVELANASSSSSYVAKHLKSPLLNLPKPSDTTTLTAKHDACKENSTVTPTTHRALTMTPIPDYNEPQGLSALTESEVSMLVGNPGS